MACDGDLVDLLVILAGGAVVGHLRRQCIIRHALQIVCPLHVARNLQQSLGGKHHLYCRAQLRAGGRLSEAQHLVAAPQTCRKPDGGAYVVEGFLRSLKLLGILALLIVYNRLLESLSEIYAVQTERAGEVVLIHEHVRPVERLLVDKLAEVEQKLLAGDIVEPIDAHKIVASAKFSPRGPVSQRVFRQLRQLIAEIACHEVDDAAVVRCRIILLHDFKHHHPWPPVVRVVALKSRLVFEVCVRTEIAVGLLRSQRPFNPGARLLY